MLTHLLSFAPPTVTATPPWVTPVVGLAGVLFGALIAGGFRLRGDKVARRAEAQRTALNDLQEGVLDLRTALRNYGNDLPRPSNKLTKAVDLANGRVDLLVHRIEHPELRHSVATWRTIAQQYWLDDQSVSINAEDVAWRTVHYKAGVALSQLDRLLLE
ncbi:hypothetical protein [Nocardioides sp. cx-173]|uniref:hypothetical protein n=1 Tax=Nocardioides sp. cx-173 TaxID=2898796 RepID=UPI001E419256|nr:hypothetical protein [Nocardioides sp. cx-173]MCD4525246.1 hypothetical protein [Nocardioides sp. cx-173]UGB40951.1 hypothetical protein LQ940_16435 [Nocardioides sp. cx-173]